VIKDIIVAALAQLSFKRPSCIEEIKKLDVYAC